MNYKFLIVDDSAIIRETVSDYSLDLNHDPVLVSCGEDALEIVKEKDFDLIFLDIYMPGINGFETLEEIRKIKPQQKVIIMTSDRDEEVFGDTFDKVKRVSGFINKPFTLEIFSNCVKTVLVLNGKFSHKKESIY